MRDDPTLRVSVVVPIFHSRPIGYTHFRTKETKGRGMSEVAQGATFILHPSAFILGSHRYFAAGTFIPFFTAGRAEIASNQRFTPGKSLRSVLCHSWRATHG